MLVEAIGMTIAADGIDKRPTHTSLLADVIFNKRARSPSVDAEVIIASIEGTDIVTDRVGGARIPAFAGDNITDIGPGHGEIARIGSGARKRNARRAAADITLPEEAVVRARAGLRRYCYTTRHESGEDYFLNSCAHFTLCFMLFWLLLQKVPGALTPDGEEIPEQNVENKCLSYPCYRD